MHTPTGSSGPRALLQLTRPALMVTAVFVSWYLVAVLLPDLHLAVRFLVFVPVWFVVGSIANWVIAPMILLLVLKFYSD